MDIVIGSIWRLDPYRSDLQPLAPYQLKLRYVVEEVREDGTTAILVTYPDFASRYMLSQFSIGHNMLVVEGMTASEEELEQLTSREWTEVGKGAWY